MAFKPKYLLCQTCLRPSSCIPHSHPTTLSYRTRTYASSLFFLFRRQSKRSDAIISLSELLGFCTLYPHRVKNGKKTAPHFDCFGGKLSQTQFKNFTRTPDRNGTKSHRAPCTKSRRFLLQAERSGSLRSRCCRNRERRGGLQSEECQCVMVIDCR